MCLLLKVKRPVPTRSMEKVCKKNLVLQIDRGNLINRLKTSVLSVLAMEQGNLLSKTAQVHTQWKNNFVPEENRDIASLNTDNEFNRAINEDNIDFNIPGLPHSAVKRSHSVNVQNLIQKIENHPQRRALQSDLQQHRQFNPFSKESRDVITAARNTELCEVLDVERKAVQSMSSVLGRRHRLLHVRALLSRWYNRKQDVYLVRSWPLFDSQLLHHERATPRPPLREEGRGSRVLHREFAQEEMQEARFLGYSRTGSFVMKDPARAWLNWVALKKYVVRWTNWRTRITHITLLQKKLVCTATIGGSVRILLVPTRCPMKPRADFKQALSTLRRLEKQEDQAYYQNWWQSSSSSWWNWQDSWWHSSSECHRDDGPSTDRSGKPC